MQIAIFFWLACSVGISSQQRFVWPYVDARTVYYPLVINNADPYYLLDFQVRLSPLSSQFSMF